MPNSPYVSPFIWAVIVFKHGSCAALSSKYMQIMLQIFGC